MTESIKLQIQRSEVWLASALETGWGGQIEVSEWSPCSFMLKGDSKVVKASGLDASWAPPFGSFPGTPNWEETLG